MPAAVLSSNAQQFTGSGSTATHIGLWTAAAGGTFKGSLVMTAGVDLPVNFAIGEIELTEADGVFVASNSAAALTARKDEITHVSLHTAAPGAGTTGLIAGGRKSITWGNVTTS